MNDNSAGVHTLHWELSVLARAIAHSNLSTAAQQIGISQPQLSRIVQKLERELSVVLLDRSARRKSGWLPQAEKLAETYSKAAKRMESELRAAVSGAAVDTFRLGSLEGCIPIANRILGRFLNRSPHIRHVEVEVDDLGVLEQKFLKGTLDVILSLRAPGRSKYRHEVELGVQRLEKIERKSRLKRVSQIMSSFEWQSRESVANQNSVLVVSNSLEVRRHWLEEFGGTGTLPGELERGERKTARDGQVTLSLYGSDVLPPDLWKALVTD